MQRLFSFLPSFSSEQKTPAPEVKVDAFQVDTFQVDTMFITSPTAYRPGLCEREIMSFEDALEELEENKTCESLNLCIQRLIEIAQFLTQQFRGLKLPQENTAKAIIFSNFKNYFLAISNYCSGLSRVFAEFKLTPEEAAAAKTDLQDLQMLIDEQNKLLIALETPVVEVISAENLQQQMLSNLSRQQTEAANTDEVLAHAQQICGDLKKLHKIYQRSSKQVKTLKVYTETIKGLKVFKEESLVQPKFEDKSLTVDAASYAERIDEAVHEFRNEINDLLAAKHQPTASHQRFLQKKQQYESKELAELVRQTSDIKAWQSKADPIKELAVILDKLNEELAALNYQIFMFKPLSEIYQATVVRNYAKKCLHNIHQILSTLTHLQEASLIKAEMETITIKVKDLGAKINEDLLKRQDWKSENIRLFTKINQCIQNAQHHSGKKFTF